MRKKIALILSKKTYEKKGIWHTSQKYTISSTFSEEFSRCTIKGYEEKNTSYPFFYSRELNISSPRTPLCGVCGCWSPPTVRNELTAVEEQLNRFGGRMSYEERTSLKIRRSELRKELGL